MGLQPIYTWEGHQLVSVLFTATTRRRAECASFPEIVSHQLQFLNGIPVRQLSVVRKKHYLLNIYGISMEDLWHIHDVMIWLVVEQTPLKNMSQLG